MVKLDLKKTLKHLYGPSAKEAVEINVPTMNFIMIDGKGDPNTAKEYREAIEALYQLSYALKFKVKKELEIDYGVMPLEGLWWVDNMEDFSADDKDAWLWTMMIMQPEMIGNERVTETMTEVRKKKGPAALDKARFEEFDEGWAVQIMHIGPYAAEAPTIERLHGWIAEHGYTRRGKHHEIYLSDPRRSAPEKLKTIIRQPFAAIC